MIKITLAAIATAFAVIGAAQAQSFDPGYGANNSWQGSSANYGSYNPTPYAPTPQQSAPTGNPSGYGQLMPQPGVQQNTGNPSGYGIIGNSPNAIGGANGGGYGIMR